MPGSVKTCREQALMVYQVKMTGFPGTTTEARICRKCSEDMYKMDIRLWNGGMIKKVDSWGTL